MARSGNRDEFSDATKTRLAMRAGFRCSMPDCGQQTIGPSDESPDSVINVGVAAHICAAAPNGPRYALDMTREQRRDIRNGIWLCATHGQEVDRDVIRFTSDKLAAYKIEHERAMQVELNAGRGSFRGMDLVALGPDVVCIGELFGTSGREWTIRISHFVEGDLRRVIEFGERFDQLDPYDRYLLVNSLGDGRLLAGPPAWRRDGQFIEFSCLVEEKFPRIDAHNLGRTFATNSSNDIFITGGGIAMVEGLDALPQRIKESLSMLLGESPFHPKVGSRFKEYFDAFEDSPWLSRWTRLEVIRLACIPYRDPVDDRRYTQLQCVLHVEEIEQLDAVRAGNWVKFRFKLDVKGVGQWECLIPIFVPNDNPP
ncbi:MAG: hypothetical protein KGM99_08935 [Burkholderiales bacterium]|nr:hypothetical protein [Burkholderiales bacterium]